MGDYFEPSKYKSSRGRRDEDVERNDLHDYDDLDELDIRIPSISKEMCKLAQTGFKPFAREPKKQERYFQFIKYQLEEIDRIELLSSMNANSRPSSDISAEFADFVQVIQMFKSGQTWKSKFSTSSSTTATAGSTEQKEKDREKPVVVVKVERVIENWIPDNVVCQRFNVPYPDIAHAAKQMEKQDEKKKIMDIFGENKEQEKKRKENPSSPQTLFKPLVSLKNTGGYNLILDDSDFKRQRKNMIRLLPRSLTTRSHTCGQLNKEHIGQKVSLCGWIQHARHVGKNLIFAPIRDTYGQTQTVANSPDIIEKVLQIAPESVVSLSGIVRKRPDNDINKDMSTGMVEVELDGVQVLNHARSLPFFPSAKTENINEDVRLKYRYLDLRRPKSQQILRLRSDLTLFIRSFLISQHSITSFMEVETPLLFKSTPEGAREFIVPTRRSPGHFYALPQSPQQYKQLLMAAGCDRYFQIAKCFRDEDVKSDRQPEFTQVDLEMSFVNQESVMSLIETMLKEIWQRFLGKTFEGNFPRMTYHDAMTKVYGSDKPDLRLGMEIERRLVGDDVIEYFIVRDHGKCSNNEIKRLIKSTAESIKNERISYFRDSKELKHILKDDNFSLFDGSLAICVKRPNSPITGGFSLIGRLRLKFGEILQQKGILSVRKDDYKFLWVHSFPLFTANDCGTLESTHHPFTAPVPSDLDKLCNDPLSVHAQHYDIVLNGVEIGGGSIRVHDADLQKSIFKDVLNLSNAEISRFSHLIQALSHGCPPHGGIALGLDRLMSIICNVQSIKEVIAFPKTNTGNDLMVSSPAYLDNEFIKEYHIETVIDSDERNVIEI